MESQAINILTSILPIIVVATIILGITNPVMGRKNPIKTIATIIAVVLLSIPFFSIIQSFPELVNITQEEMIIALETNSTDHIKNTNITNKTKPIEKKETKQGFMEQYDTNNLLEEEYTI